MAKLMFDTDAKELGVEINESLNESGVKQKKYKIKGIFTTIGEKNRNGRIYPRNIWVNEVDRYQNEIKGGTINTLMEFEHPDRTEIDPMQAVAIIESLKIDGDYVMGEAVLLDNDKANQLKSLIDNKIKISVSSRGVGNLKGDTVDEYHLITYDIVSYPSDYNATMNGVCENSRLCEGIVQGKEYVQNEYGKFVESSPELTLEEKQEVIRDKVNSFLDNLYK